MKKDVYQNDHVPYTPHDHTFEYKTVNLSERFNKSKDDAAPKEMYKYHLKMGKMSEKGSTFK